MQIFGAQMQFNANDDTVHDFLMHSICKFKMHLNLHLNTTQRIDLKGAIMVD